MSVCQATPRENNFKITLFHYNLIILNVFEMKFGKMWEGYSLALGVSGITYSGKLVPVVGPYFLQFERYIEIIYTGTYIILKIEGGGGGVVSTVGLKKRGSSTQTNREKVAGLVQTSCQIASGDR